MTQELRGLKAKELTPCRICSGKIGVDLSRRFAPYRPALAGLVGVVTR